MSSEIEGTSGLQSNLAQRLVYTGTRTTIIGAIKELVESVVWRNSNLPKDVLRAIADTRDVVDNLQDPLQINPKDTAKPAANDTIFAVPKKTGTHG